MPRSGTSLVEQIIASHREARGAGELEFWAPAVEKHERVVRSQLPDEPLRHKLAEAYLAELSRHASGARHVVDKTPFNSDYLGLIHSVFPKARMIYVQRDPIDACLSCYFQQLSADIDFAMDLSDLEHYCREHYRLMRHWRSVLPPRTMLEVPYAELVANQELWSRRIVEFVGLDWDENCLRFHETVRPVMTASSWQVRQAIYGNSVGRWQNYRKHIRPLLPLRELAA